MLSTCTMYLLTSRFKLSESLSSSNVSCKYGETDFLHLSCPSFLPKHRDVLCLLLRGESKVNLTHQDFLLTLQAGSWAGHQEPGKLGVGRRGVARSLRVGGRSREVSGIVRLTQQSV